MDHILHNFTNTTKTATLHTNKRYTKQVTQIQHNNTKKTYTYNTLQNIFYNTVHKQSSKKLYTTTQFLNNLPTNTVQNFCKIIHICQNKTVQKLFTKRVLQKKLQNNTQL